MIKVRNLSKSFGKVKALNDFNMTVEKGKIYGLVGPNGSGKTTLINHLVGVYRKENGKVLINDEEVYENDKIKSMIAYMPDEVYFYTRSTVSEMKNFYKKMYPTFNDQIYEKLKEIIKIDQKSRVSNLSKGMRKQAYLHILLSIDPKVLILDEPFDGIDVIMRKKIRDVIIKEVTENNLTVIVSSHNLKELEDLCDTIGMIRKGKMIMEKELDDIKGDVNKIQVSFKEDVREKLSKEVNILKYEKKGSIDIFIVKGNKDEILNIFNKYNPVLMDLIPLTLEEVFIYEMEGLRDEEK